MTKTYREYHYAPTPEPDPPKGWWDDAACIGEDTEIFYPPLSEHGLHRRVIETYCEDCPVKAACLADDLATEGPRWGIRGGLSAADRTNLISETPHGDQLRTHCRNGHEYTPENTGTNYRGHRQCQICTKRSNLRESRRAQTGRKADAA